MKHMLNEYPLDAVFVCVCRMCVYVWVFVLVVTKKCAFLLRDY